MNERLNKSENGITLLALIITIVILVILAGITISVINNNKIIEQAEKTKFISQISEVKERIELYKQNKMMQIYIDGIANSKTDYSSIVPENLKDYIDINAEGEIFFKGDPNSKMATWAKEIGIIVVEPEIPEEPDIPEEPEIPEELDEKTKFIMQVTELRKNIEDNSSNTGIDYSSLIPEGLLAYIEVSSTGELLYRGAKYAEQAVWAEELDIRGKQEYTIEVLLGELVDLAKKYIKQTGSTTNSNQLALQYIRRNRYKGGNWDTVAGVIDTNFVTYVDNNKTQNLDINFIKDPNTDSTIDFVHSMASINGYLKTAPSDNILAQYSCWAGDLCTLTTEIYNYKKSKSPTDAQLKTYTKEMLCGNSTFSLEDMLGDADAVNIWQLIKAGKDLDDAVYGYYYGNGSSTCNNRYNKFGSYVGSLYSGSIYNACQYYLGVLGGTFSWGRIYARQLIDNYSSIPSVVFSTVSTCFNEYISERM